MQKTLEALKTLMTTANKVVAAIQDDGKISLGEGLGLATNGIKLIGIFKTLPEIKEELKNFDEEKRTTLVSAFVAEFDLKNDEAEAKIEQGIEVLSQLILMAFSKAKV